MLDGKKVLYSGMQATGTLTLGNYLGALKNWVELTDEYECIYGVMDLHSLTVRQVPAEFRKNARALYALYVAAGLDPEKNCIYYQSHVSGHAELGWILDCFTYMGELNRMTQFKDKSKTHADNINLGLFAYPTLMAADILLYRPDLVPVGDDQKQHLEITRNIAERFNGLYGMDCDAEGNIILTDVFEWKIRKITPEGVTTTLGETDFEPWFLTVDKRNGDIFVSSSSGIYKWTAEGSTQITTGNFRGIVVDKEGNLYAADQILNGIVKFKAGTWEAENLIGKGTSGYLNGSFEDALFTFPSDLAIDSNGDIYVAGNGAWDGGENLDQSIRLLDMTNRVVRLVAGGTQAGYVDANAGSAAFSGPQDLAVDKNGVIYVYDKKNNVIRKIVYE